MCLVLAEPPKPDSLLHSAARQGRQWNRLMANGLVTNFEGRYLPCSPLHVWWQWSASEATRHGHDVTICELSLVWLLRVWTSISSASLPMLFPRGDPNIPRNSLTTSPAIPDLTTTVCPQQLSLFIVVSAAPSVAGRYLKNHFIVVLTPIMRHVT